MPESETDELDYYPEGWTERIHGESYIEWAYEDDETLVVRLDGTMGDGDYAVVPITGVNAAGEEFVTKPLTQLSRDEAFAAAASLVYAMNGTAGRLEGRDEFSGDTSGS